MRKFTIFSCIILFVIASCNNEDEISDSASLNNQDDSTSEIILQERDLRVRHDRFRVLKLHNLQSVFLLYDLADTQMFK